MNIPSGPGISQSLTAGGKAHTLQGGPKIALLGESGSGKTTAMTRLLDVGVTPFLLLLDDARRLPAVADNPHVHYHFIKTSAKQTSWDWLRRAGEALKQDSATVRAGGGIGQTAFDQLSTIADTLKNFTCDKCGENFGNAYTWGPDRALCVDSLTEVAEICVGHHIGDKPVLAQYDYGPPQRILERFYRRLCLELECTLVMSVHPTPRGDTGLYQPKLIGSALAPSFGAAFDEVIYCYKVNDKGTEKYMWDTTTKNAATKRRLMPAGDKLEVNWKQLWDNLAKSPAGSP